MVGSHAMNQGSALALPMAAPALWTIWSHHLLCLIVPHHLLYTNALYSVEKGCDFDHMPLSLNLQLPWQHVSSVISESRVDIRRFKHDASKCTQYCQHLQQHIAQCTAQMSDIDNADMAVQLLHDCICNVVATVHGCLASRTNTTQHRHQPWFDIECRSKHKEIFAYAKLHPDSHLARERKKQLKQLLRRKKCTYKKLQGRQLCALAKTDPASF